MKCVPLEEKRTRTVVEASTMWTCVNEKEERNRWKEKRIERALRRRRKMKVERDWKKKKKKIESGVQRRERRALLYPGA